MLEVDCKQPLFSSVNCGETQNKRGSLPVTVTELPLVVRASEVEPTPTLLAGHANLSRLQAYLFCVLPHGFSRKRETGRGLTLEWFTQEFISFFFFQKVFVTGGNTKFPNFQERLERELLAIRPFQSTFKVFNAGEPTSYVQNIGLEPRPLASEASALKNRAIAHSMKAKLKSSAKYEGKYDLYLTMCFCGEMLWKSMSLKVILERSFFAVRITKVRLLREPIRIILFIVVQFVILLYTELYLFSDWLKAYSEFSKSAPVTSCSC